MISYHLKLNFVLSESPADRSIPSPLRLESGLSWHLPVSQLQNWLKPQRRLTHRLKQKEPEQKELGSQRGGGVEQSDMHCIARELTFENVFYLSFPIYFTYAKVLVCLVPLPRDMWLGGQR